MEQQKHTTIRYKVTISYLILVILAVAAISVLYKGIHNIVLLDSSSDNPNFKLKQINRILTDVYEAEGFSRSYFLFRNDTDLVKYIDITDKLSSGIDSLKILCETDSTQVKNLNEIDELLKQKKIIINQLVDINKNIQSDLSYSRVIDEVYLNSFENITQPLLIRGTTNVQRDSLFQLKEKTGFFNKVKTIFSSTKKLDNKQFVKSTIEQYTSYDTIYQPVQFSDSLLKTLRIALTNFKHRNDFVKQQVVSQETELLHSDRIILERIRSIVASLETEEFIQTSTFLDRSREIIRQANYSVILLGAFALLLVFIFLFIIYRDISRTKSYQNELMKARQYSEDLLKMKEEFVAIISHEIRTPLSAIIGFANQLKKTNASKTQSVCIENIETASLSLHALVNDVLDLSKSNAGKIELEQIPFSIKKSIEEVFNTFSNEANRKGLAFNIHLDESADKIVVGDKYRFSQVLSNIVNNAIKFTDEGMIDIIARTIVQEDGQLLTEIIVFDTGIGIPKEKISSIFDEFTQANSQITRKFGGTGLGLSIVHKLITLMRGTIEVSSNEGQGSTFIIKLPFPEKTDGIIRQSNEDDYSGVFKDINILVVEDDGTLRVLMDQLFISNKLNGVIASNGFEALKILEQTNFQIVFTDIQMPEMSGIELCNNIRLLKPGIPVVAFSARSPQSGTYNGMGFAGYLPKPFTENEFLRILSDTLNREFLKEESNIQNDAPEENTDYSFRLLREFTGNDAESLRLVVKTFIENTSNELTIIHNNLENEDLSSVAQRVHKLLPMFKQMRIHKLIDEMQMIEHYNELNLSKNDVLLFAEHFMENARKIIDGIKDDLIFKQN